jgi:uncharacterized NAD(P)/FAD-binding protein YdhS
MNRITIIGGGASGTLLAINLLKQQSDVRLEINLVEKRTVIGGGVAFSTEEDVHLLNVPAAKMGAFADDVEHFYKWLQENEFSYGPSDFVPRRIFGRYLREQLDIARDSAAENAQLNLFDDEAIDITFDQGKAQVHLISGDMIYSEKVVLAFGNFLPPHPSVSDRSFTISGKYFQDPWNPEVFERIDSSDSVLIVGTGLSMADVTMQLNKLGHTGPINAISTRGLLPAVHKLGFTYPSFYEEIQGVTRITDILKTVRKHIAKAEADSSDWRAVIDSLRPVTQQIWLDLPLAEKRYFMQHLSRYWNVARHRMPPDAALVIDELRGMGQLRILKGRLQKIAVKDTGGFDIQYTLIEAEHHIHADAIVNCIGSESKFDQLDSRLVSNLMNKGHIRCDDLRFGLDSTSDGHLIASDGSPGSVLFTLGTALKGVLWESTAIPEIRSQADHLAQKLSAR